MELAKRSQQMLLDKVQLEPNNDESGRERERESHGDRCLVPLHEDTCGYVRLFECTSCGYVNEILFVLERV